MSSSRFYLVNRSASLVSKFSSCFIAFHTPEFFFAEDSPAVVNLGVLLTKAVVLSGIYTTWLQNRI